MKPIVIEVNNGKIGMSISEFKKYIEDAYQQGYSDASKITTSNSPYWWRDLTCVDGGTSANTRTLTINNDICADKATATI